MIGMGSLMIEDEMNAYMMFSGGKIIHGSVKELEYIRKQLLIENILKECLPNESLFVTVNSEYKIKE